MQFDFSMKRLSHEARKFVQLQVLYTGMSAILTLFINTFLLNAYGSFSKQVLIYNVVMALVQPAAMIIAMRFTEAKNALFTQRIGFVFYGLALIVLCIFGERVSPMYPLFAIMLSFGAGYYFSVYSAQMLHYTNDDNRDLIAGALGLFGSIISITLPLISGILVSLFGTSIGYKVVFGISALLAMFALFTNKKLPQLPKHEKEPAFRKVCKTVLSTPEGRLIMIANGLSNCRSFTIPIFVTLLFYNLTPDEFLISVNSTIGYIVALLGASIYGSFVKSENRVKFSIIAAVVVTIPVLCMVFGLNIIMIVIFNAVYGFFNTFNATPVLNTHFKLMEQLNLRSEYGAETHLLREFFVSIGRVLGLTLVWIIPQTNAGAIVVLVSMSVFELINSALLHKIQKNLDARMFH